MQNQQIQINFLSLSDLRIRCPGMIDGREALIITSTYSKIIPVLLGEIPVITPKQVAFIRALSGEVEPSSAAQFAWRKFVFLQQTAFAQKQREIECSELNERIKMNERMLANLKSEQQETKAENIKLKLEVEERDQTIKMHERHGAATTDSKKTLERAVRGEVKQADEYNLPELAKGVIPQTMESIQSRLNNPSPEDVKFLVACNFYGLDRHQLSRIHNYFLDANVNIDIMASLKLAMQRVTPKGGFDPANAFAVYANTDGQ